MLETENPQDKGGQPVHWRSPCRCARATAERRRRGSSWSRTLKEQRKAIAAALRQTPSLKTALVDADWLAGTWADAVVRAAEETGLDSFPEDCPWSMDQVLDPDFIPDA